jgi:hypothetical protein
MLTESSIIDEHCTRVTIDVLPDNVLLEIFSLYSSYRIRAHKHDAWHTLVHVCRRWRNVVFASPRRLNLRLCCNASRPVKETLHVWPELPLLICSFSQSIRPRHVMNFIAALEEHSRVYDVYIDYVPNSLLRGFAAMENPFPEITRLFLRSVTTTAPVLPDSFLGGSAPRLRELELDGIPFRGLPKLLLSTGGLVYLHLSNIPRSGYISPGAIVTALSSLMRLKSLSLEFRSPRSHTNQASRDPPPLMRVALHTLTFLGFKGDREYLEDIVARIDAPLLDNVKITFFRANQSVFDAPQLSHFITRTETFITPHRAHLLISDYEVYVTLYRKKGPLDHRVLSFGLSCKRSDSHLSLFVQVYSSALAPLPTLERLFIHDHRRPLWDADWEDTQWLEVLRPFASVKDLHICEKLGSYQLVAPVLSDLAGEGVTEVLPALQNLYLKWPRRSGSMQEAIDRLVAARQLSGRPLAVAVHQK